MYSSILWSLATCCTKRDIIGRRGKPGLFCTQVPAGKYKHDACELEIQVKDGNNLNSRCSKHLIKGGAPIWMVP